MLGRSLIQFQEEKRLNAGDNSSTSNVWQTLLGYMVTLATSKIMLKNEYLLFSKIWLFWHIGLIRFACSTLCYYFQTKHILDLAEGHKYDAPSEERIHFLIVIGLQD